LTFRPFCPKDFDVFPKKFLPATAEGFLELPEFAAHLIVLEALVGGHDLAGERRMGGGLTGQDAPGRDLGHGQAIREAQALEGTGEDLGGFGRGLYDHGELLKTGFPKNVFAVEAVVLWYLYSTVNLAYCQVTDMSVSWVYGSEDAPCKMKECTQ
jgi:hypothetical protein